MPSGYARLKDAMGDQTNRFDIFEQRILEALAQPVETYLPENMPSVSPASSPVKAPAIMESCNT